ncbi:MAG: M28 family peptidase [Chloroflexi bacterium]|nr:M28 family peptidase [Chloroflexota bacterium]
MTATMKRFFILIGMASAISACAAVTNVPVEYDTDDLEFSGERAFEIETEFVTAFPNRDSGQANNRLAIDWLRGEFESLGLNCSIDEWEIINYSQPVPLNNLICRLDGQREEEILIVAHHDQAPTTIEGADNDGSGIAILLHLAELFAKDPELTYSLTFVSTDAEEYGMIGTKRFVDTHENTSMIVAGISLDNLGRSYYDGMNMELIGQLGNYGPIWLALATRSAAQASGSEWQVNLRAPLDQILDQAGPISFMDQGPMVAAGIPALGLAAAVPPESGELHYYLWHDPDDSMEYQSAQSLQQSGTIAEALIRQLLSMQSFPQESGPYIYFDSSGQILRGVPLWLLFIALVSVFFIGSARANPGSIQPKLLKFRAALPHFLALWLPMVASLLLLYIFVAVGIMDKYHIYPATSKDAAIYNPRWLAVILYVLGSGILFAIGRNRLKAWTHQKTPLTQLQTKSLGLFVIGLSGVYVLLNNAFSLLFFVPLKFWFLIRGRSGNGRVLDVSLYFSGGLVFYGLFYFFGFVIFDYGFAFGWFLLMMFSVQMVGFITASMLAAVIAAGLSMIVTPPKP